MNKYDKIMVPADEKEMSPHFIAGGMWKCERGQICMSIEEARELWNMAMERRDRDNYAMDIGKDDYNTAPTFEEYLKEFGITL